MGQRFRFQPVALDRWSPHAHLPATGVLVRKCQPAGTPRNGTMGHCFISDLATGEFYGLCLENSLQPVTHKPLDTCAVCNADAAVLLRMSPQARWYPYCDRCADMVAGLGCEVTLIPPPHGPQRGPEAPEARPDGH